VADGYVDNGFDKLRRYPHPHSHYDDGLADQKP
jgi:hypothetical protein